MCLSMEDFKKHMSSCALQFDDATLVLLYTSVITRTPVMLRGPPGTGKTEVTRVIAKILGADYVFYQCSTGTTEDDLIYKLLPDESTKSGVKVVLGALPEALKKSQKGRVVLVLDELDKTRPTADAMLLDFLQNFRVSTRLDNESIIQGNPENLWVFLTSNDEREFSEPLLRRVSVIKLKPLPSKLVREILKNRGVREDILDLLIQLYRDTLNAGLRKPATVQELLQLAKAVEVLGSEADWSSLVYSYVIKDDLEWQKFKEYLRNREPMHYEYEEENEDITEYYEEVSEHEEEKENQWSPRMPKFRIVRRELNVEPVEVESEIQEVSMIAIMDKENYATVIRDFRPEPTDNPWSFGDFRVVKDESGTYIVKENPLSLHDVIKSADLNYSGSVNVKCKESLKNSTVHIKHTLKLSESVLQTLIDRYNVVYYTRNILRFENHNGSLDFVLVREQRLNDTVSLWTVEIVSDYNSDALRYLIETLISESALYRARLELKSKWDRWTLDNEVHVDAKDYDEAKAVFEKEYKQLIVEKYNELRRAIAEKYAVNTEHVRVTAEYKISYATGYRMYTKIDTLDSDSDSELVRAILEGQ